MTSLPPAPAPLLADDAHDRELASHVHPADWVNPEPAPRYDLVVVGAGTAGLVSAAGAAGLGAKVALVERHLMGGDCLNVGCVPSKGLISAARRAADVRDAGTFGVRVPDGVTVDFAAVMERMRGLRAGIGPHDGAARFRELGIDVFLGDGAFVSSDTVKVGDAVLSFSRAVVATGARASAPPIPGLDELDYLTNETLFSLTELPKRLAVLGAGPIGCEMAQAFARFGSAVSVVEMASHVLPREEAEAGALVGAALERDGVDLRLDATTTRVSRRGDATVVHVVAGDHEQELEVDALLVAVGRAPNVEGMGLEAAGIRFDPRKGVMVDDQLQTTNPAVFAAGDVASRWQFTHTADFGARLVLRNALFPGPKGKASAMTVPWCTYTDPEVAHVGLDEAGAAERGLETEAYTLQLADVDRAILEGETEGYVRVLVPRGKDRILGATIVARHAGEMISEISVAMAGGMGLGKLAGVIHPYPTQAEAIRRVGDLYNRTRLKPWVKRLMERWFAWRR
jgi:pyruvate/2-oxoglutarate dehydrogenase complex dihydrolipoamide dehydrogenase (E3) component